MKNNDIFIKNVPNIPVLSAIYNDTLVVYWMYFYAQFELKYSFFIRLLSLITKYH